MPMICGTDRSPASAEALAAAVAVASRRGEKRVILALVVPSAGDGRDAELGRVLAEVTPIAAQLGVSVESRVLRGAPAESLVELARAVGANVIVLGARGPSSTGDDEPRPPGLADQLADLTPVPIVVVRSAAPFQAWAVGSRRLRALLGVDNSHAAAVAMSWTRAFVGLGGIDIVLGSIFYADEAAAEYGVRAPSMVDDDPELVRLITRDALRRWGQRGEGFTVEARARHGLGRIGDHLLELADDGAADLIIVGANQRRGIAGFGSVSSVVVHDAKQSVICVPSCAPANVAVPSIKVAVVATDGSEFANRAIPYAFAVTEREGGEVHLVRALDDDEDPRAIEAQLRALAPAGFPQKLEVHLVRSESPAEAVATTAARLGADVICIASHGRSGISRALVGSVADKLMRATRVPVLVLRP